MFGVIVEVTLKTSENTCLEMDSMQLSCKRTSAVDNRSEFERIYHMTRVQKHVRQTDESDLDEEDEPGPVELLQTAIVENLNVCASVVRQLPLT